MLVSQTRAKGRQEQRYADRMRQWSIEVEAKMIAERIVTDGCLRPVCHAVHYLGVSHCGTAVPEQATYWEERLGIRLCMRHQKWLAENGPCATCAAQAAAVAFRHEREEEAERTGVVYYARRPDGLIKIGTTQNLPKRLAAHRKAGVPLELLATEPGYYRREAERHEEFHRFRVGIEETFRPSRRLMAHVRRLAE